MLNTSQHTSGALRKFKFDFLQKITNEFSKDRILGRGSFGVVYKGVLENGEKIAVKKLIYTTQDDVSEKQFHNECTNLMRVQHPNIVQLIGYCYETHHECVEYDGKYVFAGKNESALCLEYLEGGSLEEHVLDEPCRLPWDKCYTIIKGVCKGLNHLHEYSIFHLDIKPGNILLDKSMTPKIGDFGLSRLFSSTKTCTTTTPLGTPGYIPPEYINNQEISPKYDVFSLGIVMIHIMAGRKQYNDHFRNPSKVIELVSEHWEKRIDATIWAHASQEVNTCIEIALRCVKSDRQERPIISQIVEDLNTIDMAKLSLTYEGTNLQRTEALVYNSNSILMGVHDSATQFDSMECINYITAVSDEGGDNDNSMHHPMDYLHESIMRNSASTSISEHQDVTRIIEVDNLEDRKRNPHIRAEGNLRIIVSMGILDTIGNLFEWARSNILSQWSSTQEKMLHNELFRLKSTLQRLIDTLPAMYELIDRAEWRSHKHHVAEYLAKLKDVVYDADDLLDEFRWYMLKVQVEGNGAQDFFISVIQGRFTKLVNGIQNRMDNISTHLRNMGLHEVTTRFDKSIRPETSSFPNETKIFGRDKELKQIIEWLCEPKNNSNATLEHHEGNCVIDVSTSASTSQVHKKLTITNLHVLPIVGIGGVGKTTLAQHICSNSQVKSNFKQIIWVCASDDFDVKRLTKEAIECCREKQEATGNLNSLQKVLSDIVSGNKYLIVLDDMWDDVLKENGQCWKRFCAPLKNVLHGSVILVTTRCQKVSDRVGTRDAIALEGLKDDVFWEFFKQCVFEYGSLNNKDPELERIARRIAPKLKGSPLAAKTLGRILGMNLQAKYWNAILESELWKLRQEDTEILPALRLSYMYLPFHLKRCFSLCAVWPKDYKYKKGYLIGIWLALGFVEPQGDIPIEDIACEYFNDLLHRSFFQEVSGLYIIHDLLHDMAQKVSEFDCFIIKRRSDIEKIPANVRHLSILSSTDINYSNLLGLRRFTKLRTLLCGTHLDDEKTSPSLLADWCSEFQCLRVIDFASTHELPASIGTLKHLRHLRVGPCHFKSLPSEFCWLYNLQFVMFNESKLESLPTDFSKLICLQNFTSQGFRCDSMCRRSQGEELYYKVWVDVRLGFSFIKNISQLGELEIYNIGKPIRKEHAAEAQLHNKKYLEKLMLTWSLSRNPEESDIEVLRYLQPPTCLKSLLLHGYPGVSLPSLFQPQNLRSSMSPLFVSSGGLENSSVPRITDLLIDGCGNLSSIEHVIHPAYVSSLKKMTIKNCKKLVSVVAERFKDLRCLEEFEVQGCPHIYSQSLVTPSLKRLLLGKENNWGDGYICGNLVDDVDCCSLTYLFLSGNSLTSIQLHKWNLPSLEKLHISQCDFLTSIGGTEGVRAFPSLTDLTIEQCYNLSTLDDLLAEEYLPSIERIHVKYCNNLVSLPGERFGNFSSLKELQISGCNMLSWRGFVLPSSLQILSLYDCGDISAFVPSCLQDLASLVTLKIYQCRCITSIPCNLWRTNLTSLENLMIWECEDIVSIGGENAVSEIRNVSILACPNLKELKQPMVRGSYVQS